VPLTTIPVSARSAVADPVLEHHRANFRPRVAPASPSPPAATAAPRAVEVVTPSVRPSLTSPRVAAATAAPAVTARAALGQVLLIRFLACVLLWAAAGIVYGFWQLGDALMPNQGQRGVVICGTSRDIGSVPGC